MIRTRLGVGLLLAALAAVSGSAAQDTAPAIVLDAVEIRGLERASEANVRSQLEAKPGDAFDPRVVSRDLPRLMKLGLFKTAKADLEGRTLIYTVVEEQTIREIRIVGNKKLKTRQVRSAIQWHEGLPFYREGYGEERDAVTALYRKKGFLNATVEIVVEPVAPGEVRVTYAIVEGKKARISEIRYVGNQALTKRKLKKVVKTRKAIMGLGGRYDQDKFENDLLKVIDAYGDVGRLEAAVTSTRFDSSPNGKKLAIEINIAEGPEYTMETLDIANNVVYRDDELLGLAKLKPGAVHNKSQVAADAGAVEQLYQTSGYVNAGVVPQVTLNREKHTTSVSHQVQEDELKYLREVRVTGNSVTRDDVVRRNVLLKPGERFDGSLLEASQRRLEATQYFNQVRMRPDDVKDNERFTNLLVDVEEGKAGNFNFGAAFNTDTGVGGFAEIRLNNFDITDWPTFSGGGQVLGLNGFLGTERSTFRLSFTDPEVLGYPFSLGFDAYDERQNGTGSSEFDVSTLGSSLRLGKRLSIYNSASMELSFEDTTIDDLDSFSDPALRELEDPGSTLSVTLGLSRNTANDFRNPTKGGEHSIYFEVAGGLDNEFVGLNHDSTWFYGLKRWDRLSFALRVREGILFPYGDKDYVPINARFFAGGTNLRGYDFRAVGPRADTFRIENGVVNIHDESVGGELRLLQSIEAKYRVTDILRFYTFFDSGAVFFKPEDINFSDFRFAVGVGVGIDVPFLGPFRIDYGFPLNPDGSQGSGQLHLQSSVRF